MAFAQKNVVPGSGRQVSEVARFELDYTFYLNLSFAIAAAVMVWLHRQSKPAESGGHDHGNGGLAPKRIIALIAATIMVVGIAVSFL